MFSISGMYQEEKGSRIKNYKVEDRRRLFFEITAFPIG